MIKLLIRSSTDSSKLSDHFLCVLQGLSLDPEQGHLCSLDKNITVKAGVTHSL